MSRPRDDSRDDLFRSFLEAIINLRHPLVRPAGENPFFQYFLRESGVPA